MHRLRNILINKHPHQAKHYKSLGLQISADENILCH